MCAAAVQNDEAIYSPQVTVFRAPESKGHVFLQDPYRIAMIACPGLYRPQLETSGKIAAQHIQQLECKLDLILKMAACFGHDAVVLGPMGCGGELRVCYACCMHPFSADYLCCVHAAWQNPHAEVAEVFVRVLQRDIWGLKQVVVACLSTGNQGMEKSPYLRVKSNYQYFAEALFPDTDDASDGKTEEDTKAQATMTASQSL